MQSNAKKNIKYQKDNTDLKQMNSPLGADQNNYMPLTRQCDESPFPIVAEALILGFVSNMFLSHHPVGLKP